ncbi:MAG: ABC transporter substrate-binding protein [Eubacteriales bacterium]|nr:ABC transporter substrate-binding protein [Eubacteriales bacterium]
MKHVRRFLLLLTAVVMLSGLTGIGALADDQTTIEMWYHISPDQATVLLQMIDEFQQLNPDIKVETQSVAFAEIKKQLSIGAAADQLPDVTLCDTVDNASFAAMGVAMDITDEVNAWGEADNFFDGPRNSAIYEGRYYGLPYYSNCLAIMYNKDILDEMGVAYPTSDWTWDDFKQIVAETTTADHYGLTMSLIKSEEGTFNVIPFIWQAGADWNDLNSDGAKEALTMINDFYQKGYMSRELISMTQADMNASLFCTGKSALMVAGSWLKKNIANENPDLNYGVVTFPNYKNAASPIGGGNILMMKDDHRAASWKLMAFLSSKDNSRKFSESAGYFSSRKDSVAESTLWLEDPVLSVYLKQLEVARARGPHPQWPTISSAIQNAYQDVLSGSATVDDALAKAAEDIAKIQ